MQAKAVYLLVIDGFADWEPAHAVAELRRTGGYRVETAGLTPDPVSSMGGVRVLPSTTIAAVDPEDAAVFILPGGDRWGEPSIERELQPVLERLDRHRVPIAAICAATAAIARMGLLNGRKHTSNGLDFLKSQAPGYRDERQYIDAPAVRDRGLITASGLADVEFARELFEELNVLTAADRAVWAAMFRSARLPSTG